MAKSKKLKVEDIRAHFFMSIHGNRVDIIYHDDADNGASLGAAFASAMEEDKELLKIISAALLTTLESKEENANWERVRFPKKEKKDALAPLKEKYISKKSNTVPKTVKKVAKKK